MFREAGIRKSEMGTYGKTIRPYLDSRQAGAVSEATGPPNYTTVEMMPQHLAAKVTGATGSKAFGGSYDAANFAIPVGGWTRTRFGTVPSYVATTSGGGPETTLAPADEWTLMLAGPTVLEATGVDSAASYKTVGAVHAYNMDRQAVQVQETDTSVDFIRNPLSALADSGNQASGEILEIASNQQEMVPPHP